MVTPREHSPDTAAESPPPPASSSTAAAAAASTTSNTKLPPLAAMNVSYAPTATTTFPSTTDAWLSSNTRPTISTIKTGDDSQYRSSSSSASSQFYAASGTPNNTSPSLAASTPRNQWLHDAGRRPSYGSSQPQQQQYSPASYAPSPVSAGPLGPPGSGQLSPGDEWSPSAYSPQGASYLPGAPPMGTAYHHHQPYPAAVPLHQSGPQMGHIPMPIPLGNPQPRRRGKLPKATTEYLKDWLHKHADHPYPTEDEKKRLCAVTGLSMSQVSNWMINARRRILAPARANATPATTTTPYGAPPMSAPLQQQPLTRPGSGDSSSTRSSDLLYNPYQQQQQQQLNIQTGQLPGHHSQPHSPSSAQRAQWTPTTYASYPAQQDGSVSRGSPHSTVSDHAQDVQQQQQ